jgi:hypothetical protein
LATSLRTVCFQPSRERANKSVNEPRIFSSVIGLNAGGRLNPQHRRNYEIADLSIQLDGAHLDFLAEMLAQRIGPYRPVAMIAHQRANVFLRNTEAYTEAFN